MENESPRARGDHRDHGAHRGDARDAGAARRGTASVTVLDGTPALSTTLSGSVSGLLHVPAGETVDIHGVLEDAVVSGPGTVRVAGLIAETLFLGPGRVLCAAGSVIAPQDPTGDWLVLGADGVWTESDRLVVPEVAPLTDAEWSAAPIA